MESPVTKQKYVFICRRNIFRSQIAKGVCISISGGRIDAQSYGTQVASAGTEGMPITSFPGMNDTIAALLSEGVDISKEKCRQVTADILKGIDRIVVMSEKEFVPKWLEEYPYEYWDIPNPDTVTAEYARDIIEKIKGKVAALVAEEIKI
jgi:protein-tyrosine-phosphatase